jgi:hypothetical protein
VKDYRRILENARRRVHALIDLRTADAHLQTKHEVAIALDALAAFRRSAGSRRGWLTRRTKGQQ